MFEFSSMVVDLNRSEFRAVDAYTGETMRIPLHGGLYEYYGEVEDYNILVSLEGMIADFNDTALDLHPTAFPGQLLATAATE